MAYIGKNEIISDYIKQYVNPDDFESVESGAYFSSMGNRKQEVIIFYDMDTDDDLIISNDDIEAEFIGKDATELVKYPIQQMDYPYKRVLLLQYYTKMKGRDIAENLNLKPENVRQIAKRARIRLKNLLEEKGYI